MSRVAEWIAARAHRAKFCILANRMVRLFYHFGDRQTQAESLDIANGQSHETHRAQHISLLDKTTAVCNSNNNNDISCSIGSCGKN